MLKRAYYCVKMLAGVEGLGFRVQGFSTRRGRKRLRDSLEESSGRGSNRCRMLEVNFFCGPEQSYGLGRGLLAWRIINFGR